MSDTKLTYTRERLAELEAANRAAHASFEATQRERPDTAAARLAYRRLVAADTIYWRYFGAYAAQARPATAEAGGGAS